MSKPKTTPEKKNPILQHFESNAAGLDWITAALDEGVLIVSADGVITDANAAFLEQTGFEEAEVIGQTCRIVLGLTDEKQNSVCEMHCPGGSEEIIRIKGSINTSSDTPANVEISRIPLLNANGESDGWVIVIHWDKEKLYSELNAAQLSNITHEFQTPISIIKAFASTLARPGVSWSEATIKDKLAKIEKESDRLSAMVNTLMEVFRADAGELVLTTLKIDLKATVERILQRFAGNWDREFQNAIPDGMPTVVADPEKLETILNNLLGNAIKFSPPGSVIKVSAATGKGEVWITVADNGIGIVAEDHERIFERFYRVDSGDSKKRAGVGLGLSICKSLIEAQGGRIRVASKIGQGANFTFSLPLDKPNPGRMGGKR